VTRAASIVDAHLHAWDLTRGDYAWNGPQHGAIHRSFLPEEAVATVVDAGADAAVLVQAEDSETDTRYLLAAMDAHDEIVGVVGWVRLDDPVTAEEQLADYGARLCGVRHLVHDDPRDGFLELAEVRRSLGLLAERDLAYDVPDAWPRHLRRIPGLADALPGLTIVVDHLGKPPRGTDHLSEWERQLREVAARPNTVAKVSGLQSPGQPFTTSSLRPVLEVALEAFGAERLMLGGDWPMTVPHGGHGSHWAVLRKLVAELTRGEQEALLHRTADRVYRLGG